MKTLILLVMLFPLFLNSVSRYMITIFLSIIWLIYTLYYTIHLYKLKDKKIKTDKYLEYPPNNNHPSYIRFLYKGKTDYKVFISMIMELILKESISLVRHNGSEYSFIDNKNEVELTKSEIHLKKMLFQDIGNKECVYLDKILLNAKKNSGYFYSIYKEWMHTFDYECVKNKYFKSIKQLVDDGMFYFMISMILVLYNLFFTKFIFVSLVIFYYVSLLIKKVNDCANMEEDVKEEYENWLKFKNYIKKEDNTINELDITTLENYALYAYVLDEYDEFVKIVNKKFITNKDEVNKSVILSIINARVFDELENSLKKSIKISKVKTVVLFARNKGKGNL